MIGNMFEVAFWLIQSPVIWVPLLSALFVWVFMIGYRIGTMR